MKTVHILSDFDGYPNGKDKQSFATGGELELADAYADLLVDKGLAREKPTTTAPAKPAAKTKD